MKCVIIDDEEIAIKVIKSHLEKIKGVEVIASFQSANEAFLSIQKSEVDLLFLDIEMPGISGFQLIKSLNRRPKIVITTAHREYAIDGYQYDDIVDYLLKPISFERIALALSKASDQLALEKKGNKEVAVTFLDDVKAYVFVKSDGEHIKVAISDILYIESLKNHIKINTSEKGIITLISIGKILDKLPEKAFIRIHKTCIVAFSQIEKYTHDYVYIQGQALPIGRTYRPEFLEKMKGLSM